MTLSTLSNLSFKDSVSTVGFLYSSGKTIVKYADRTIDIQKTRSNVLSSNIRQLDSIQMAYTGLAGMKVASSILGVVATAAFGPVGGLLSGLAFGILNGIMENLIDETYDEIKNNALSNMNFLVDPSGYVYACVESNRIAGAKVTTYWIPYDEDDETFWDNPDESKSQVWNADEYSQLNPLYTDDHGDYAWDVPEGWWKVVAEKDGYETFTTDWLPVPPPQTEVNIGLISNTVPFVAGTAVEDHIITLTFNEYMDPDTVKNIVVKDYYNAEVGYTVSY